MSAGSIYRVYGQVKGLTLAQWAAVSTHSSEIRVPWKLKNFHKWAFKKKGKSYKRYDKTLCKVKCDWWTIYFLNRIYFCKSREFSFLVHGEPNLVPIFRADLFLSQVGFFLSKAKKDKAVWLKIKKKFFVVKLIVISEIFCQKTQLLHKRNRTKIK